MKKYLEILLIVVAVMFGLSTILACAHQTKRVASDPIGTYDLSASKAKPINYSPPDQNREVAKPINYPPPPAEFKQSLPLAKYNPARDIEMDPKNWVETRPTSLKEKSLPLAKMEPNWVDTGDARITSKVDPCQGEGCGNRNSNPKWSFVSQRYINGIRLIYGRDGGSGGPWIQSKWFVPNKEAQVVVTNWDGKSDITARLAAAKVEARRTERRIRSGELPADCGQKHCYVCEH